MSRVLVLGGTREGRQLAEALGPKAVLSLAGTIPAALAPGHRRGGFGGVEGLVSYLKAEQFQALIDATHPFAAQISHHAHRASATLALPLLRLERPPWPPAPGWQLVRDLPAAAKALPPGARVLLTVGGRSVAPFLAREDVWFLTRAIVPPPIAPPGALALQRPPFTPDAERALMQRHGITHLVSKNAGGSATSAKLSAAAALGVQVVMVTRPALPPVRTVATVADALAWARAQPEGNAAGD